MAKRSDLQRAIDELDAQIAAKKAAHQADLQGMEGARAVLMALQRDKSKRKTAAKPKPKPIADAPASVGREAVAK